MAANSDLDCFDSYPDLSSMDSLPIENTFDFSVADVDFDFGFDFSWCDFSHTNLQNSPPSYNPSTVTASKDSPDELEYTTLPSIQAVCFNDAYSNNPAAWSDPSNSASQATACNSGTNLTRAASLKPASTQSQSTFPDFNSETSSEGKMKRRKVDASFIVFSAKGGQEIKARQRTRFDQGRRRQVALNRRIGACIQCKLRKNSCNFGMPCDACIKRAGSVALGQRLCGRQSLVTTRFNDVDFLRITDIGLNLETHRQPLIHGSEKDIYLVYRPCLGEAEINKLVSVKICSFKSWFGEEEVDAYSQTILLRDHETCGQILVPNYFYAIAEDSLPTLDDLVGMFPKIASVSGPFHGVHRACTAFAAAYCDFQGTLPLQQMMRKTVRLASLFRIYRRGCNMKFAADDSESTYISSWMNFQIRHLVGKGIMELEAEILDDLDRLLHSEGPGRQNPLATWICLWVLVLVYKEQMAFLAFHYMNQPLTLNPLFGLARHLYNTLTSIYAALYRTTSPLTFDWQTDEISGMLGSDPQLIQLFCDIKTEMNWFHLNKDKLSDEDSLFKALVVENESKLVRANIKAAKKKDIL